MQRRLFVTIGLFLSSFWALAFGVPDTVLQPKPMYGRQAKLITYILDNNHYRKLRFNDSLSAAALDAYIASLDNNRTYFLKQDIESFEKFRYGLDDFTLQESVQPAYIIYSVFQKRFSERMDYVLKSLVGSTFDYTAQEYYDTDRDQAPWPASLKEMNDLWTQIIKSQALSLRLAGKSQPEIEEALRSRYDRFVKSMSQTNSEDVFGIYMNAITESYDPHTNYFSPKTADLFKQNISQSLEGIGARLQTENDYTKIAEILPGGPAEKSDRIHVNDRIIGVGQGEDGEMVDVIGWRLDDVVKLIKGPKGTRVRLSVLPAATGVNGPAVEISLIRDKIKLEDLTAKKKMIDYSKDGKAMKMGVITLPSFYLDWEAYQKGDPNYNSTSRDVQKFIKELQAEGMDGLVIDLRNNGGGSLAEAIDLTGLFIKDGPVVQVRNSANRTEVLDDENPAVEYTGPLVVLTNRFSASASEIFAGAIQDYKRGVVVGESTYGKGTVQTMVELDRYFNENQKEAGSLKLTIQKYYRVNGSSTQHKGVTPDISFPTALKPEQFGESSSPSALPWDEIRGTLYQKSPAITSEIMNGLVKSYQQRLKSDPYLMEYVRETEETRKSLSDTRISLNEDIRKTEQAEAERRQEKKKPGNVQLDREGRPIVNPLNLDDEYLREGLLVLGDLIASKIG